MTVVVTCQERGYLPTERGYDNSDGHRVGRSETRDLGKITLEVGSVVDSVTVVADASRSDGQERKIGAGYRHAGGYFGRERPRLPWAHAPQRGRRHNRFPRYDYW